MANFTYVHEIGDSRDIDHPFGDDRSYYISITSGGSLVTINTSQGFLIRIISKNDYIIDVNYDVYTTPTQALFSFNWTSAHTAHLPPGAYKYDLTWTDAAGNKTQVIKMSTYNILPSSYA